jgi:hypothetical protein
VYERERERQTKRQRREEIRIERSSEREGGKRERKERCWSIALTLCSTSKLLTVPPYLAISAAVSGQGIGCHLGRASFKALCNPSRPI